MARTRTLTQLIAEVRERADIEGDPHITDAEITRFINQSGAGLHGQMVDLDETYFMSTLPRVTAAGVETVLISKDNAGADTNLYKILHVEATVNGWVRSLERWTFDRRTLYKNASSWGVTQMPVAYRMIKQQAGGVLLYFSPTPDAIYTLSIEYVKAYVDLVTGSDTYEGYDGWEEWVVWDAAIKALVKAESSITDATAERDRVYARIATQMASPDLDHPSIVRDTESDGAGTFPWQVR